MPGIITHKKIFLESLKLLESRKKRTYLLRSLSALFSTPEQLKAALFGTMGPNIFDYIPRHGIKDYYGHEASFFLHNGGSDRLIESMVHRIFDYDDKNNEWAAMQRAYLYGFISHLTADTIFHPYIFYWSGFPDSLTRKEIVHYREQNLLFQYNIDNYYLYKDENRDELSFDIDTMIPLDPQRHFRRLNPSVKDFILKALNDVYPEIYRKMVWRDKKERHPNYTSTLGWLDVLPAFITANQKFKQNYNERLRSVIREIRTRKLFYSDFIVQYPAPRKINIHLLNFHRERWNYPAEQAGFRYESVEDLCRQACEDTVILWEKIESSIYSEKPEIFFEEARPNTYTGVPSVGYFDMTQKSPSRIYA